jgi:preprotein translocase subunit YajC
MHILHAILAQATSPTTTAKSKSGGSSELSLVFIVFIFVGAYFFFIRPRQQRMRRQQVTAKQLAVGDLVISAGGIHGKIVSLDDDVAEVEVAPNVVLTFLKRAINVHPEVARAPQGPVDDDDDWDVTPAADRTALPAADGEDDIPAHPGDEAPDLPPSGDV